jgi:hypothetical protein
MAYIGEFNTDELLGGDEPQNEYGPIPEGWYTAVITDAPLKETRSGTGHYIKLSWKIEGPKSVGRLVWQNLNVRNDNPKAEEIGRRQLGEVSRAIGLAKISDSDQLIGGRCEIKIVVRNDETYGSSNEIKGVRAVSGSAPPAPASNYVTPAAPSPAPAKTAAPKAPWDK